MELGRALLRLAAAGVGIDDALCQLFHNFELPAEVYEELTRTSHRHYSPGFYFGREQARQATDSATYIREWEFVLPFSFSPISYSWPGRVSSLR